jgi:hypothetical protein
MKSCIYTFDEKTEAKINKIMKTLEFKNKTDAITHAIKEYKA